jgi:hypothetical protein
MKKKTILSLAAASAIMMLVGCQSSTSSGDSTSVVGSVVDGYVSDAIVCLDIDRSFTCEVNEPQTRTDAEGKYELNGVSEEDLLNYPIIAYGGVDNTAPDYDWTGIVATRYTKERADDLAITPLTTMVTMVSEENDIDKDEAAKMVAQVVGLDETELWEDPIKTNNAEAYEVALKVHKSVELLKTDTEADVNEQFMVGARAFADKIYEKNNNGTQATVADIMEEIVTNDTRYDNHRSAFITAFDLLEGIEIAVAEGMDELEYASQQMELFKFDMNEKLQTLRTDETVTYSDNYFDSSEYTLNFNQTQDERLADRIYQNLIMSGSIDESSDFDAGQVTTLMKMYEDELTGANTDLEGLTAEKFARIMGDIESMDGTDNSDSALSAFKDAIGASEPAN